MRVVSHPEADEEVEAAAFWYEDRQLGLGEDFLEEYHSTLTRIHSEPERWRKVRSNHRKLNFHRFPYAVIYKVRNDMIYVIAVMHLHRRPSYWVCREFPI